MGGPPISRADQAKARFGQELSGKALKKAKRAIYRKNNRRFRENNSLRSQIRQDARAVNIQSGGAVEDFPIAKGGRCGRQLMERVMQAAAKGDIGAIRKIVQDFDAISQPRSAYFYSCSHLEFDACL